jgi:hypothetical protein
MRLKEWQLEQLLRTTALLVTYYLDRERPPAYSLFHVSHGPSHVPYATEALCRYVIDARKDVVGSSAAFWATEHHEEAIALAIEAREAGERPRQG